jgi:hypothetical protein
MWGGKYKKKKKEQYVFKANKRWNMVIFELGD